MSLLSLICALILEQWRPLAERHALFSPAQRLSDHLEAQFNAGQAQQGVIAWMLAVLPAVIGAWLLYLLCAWISPLLALAFNVGVLYLTMGFRQFSHYFTDINLALKEDDIEKARELLARWRGSSCAGLSSEEIARLTIEEALTASHRHVFGVVFWFVILPGPAGAVLYRLSMYLRRRWGSEPTGEFSPAVSGGQFGHFARDAFMVLDWMPVRVTAAAFAVVGDFEDAVYCWRNQAANWTDPALGLVLAAGAGALGVRLGMPIEHGNEVVDRPELGVGEEADASMLDSTVGLVWRALVLYLLMLLLIGIAQAVR